MLYLDCMKTFVQHKINFIKDLVVLFNEIYIQDSSSFDIKKIYMSYNKGWDRLRGYFWNKHVDIKKLDHYRNYFGKATIKGRIWRSIAFPAPMRPGYDLFGFYMKPKHIKFLQTLNNDTNSSSGRAVAKKFSKKFPETNIDSSCQYDGRWLCLYAYELTGDPHLEK